MFWEEFEKLRDVNVLEVVDDVSNIVLIKCWFDYIFKGDLLYFNMLRLGKYDREFQHLLINYLALIIIAGTKYHNYYIRNFAVKHFRELVRDLPNEVPVWEFIRVASKSRNNDLHLERVDLSGGVVRIYRVKATYAVEVIRVKLMELVGVIQKSGMLKVLQDHENVKYIVDHVESIVVKKGPSKGFVFNLKVSSSSCEGEIPYEWHPPCIRGILKDILSGGSPSHYARRSFVVYWFCAHFNPNLRPFDEAGEFVNVCAEDVVRRDVVEKFVDSVVDLFRNVEDFNERKTRYYVCHNIGYEYAHYLTHCEYCKNWRNDGGKGLGYYCNPDELCELRERNNYPVVIHPLDYLCYNTIKHRKK